MRASIVAISILIIGFMAVIFARHSWPPAGKRTVVGVSNPVARQRQPSAMAAGQPSFSAGITSATRTAAVRAAHPAPAARGYKKRYEQAGDYFVFAHSVLAAATAHDADAEYYLWSVMDICAHDPTSGLSSLDEAEQMGAKIGLTSEAVHDGWARCHQMLTTNITDLGDSWSWLNRAVKDGQPVAGVAAVGLRLFQDSFRGSTGRLPGGFPEAPIGGDATSDPHPLVLKALQSGDPDALLAISSVSGHLNPNPTVPVRQTVLNQWAWGLLACQRGANCVRCGRYCDPTQLMQMAGNDWATVQQRAQALSQDLDSQQWGQLGLGLSDASE